MGNGASLDAIIKNIIYGNVKSYDLLMRNFYTVDQGEEESVTSYATQVEALLSQIRDKFPDQIPLEKEKKNTPQR